MKVHTAAKVVKTYGKISIIERLGHSASADSAKNELLTHPARIAPS